MLGRKIVPLRVCFSSDDHHRDASRILCHPAWLSNLGWGWCGSVQTFTVQQIVGAIRWGVVLTEWAYRGDVLHNDTSQIFGKRTLFGDVCCQYLWTPEPLELHFGYQTISISSSFLWIIPLFLPSWQEFFSHTVFDVAYFRPGPSRSLLLPLSAFQHGQLAHSQPFL